MKNINFLRKIGLALFFRFFSPFAVAWGSSHFGSKNSGNWKHLFISLKKTFLFTCLFLLASTLGHAQNVGDYQSKGNGDWNSPGTWQVCTQVTPSVVWANVTAGYPGKSTTTSFIGTVPAGSNTATVTIQSCHEVTMNTGDKVNKIVPYDKIQKMIVNGRMTLIQNNDVSFSSTLQELLMDGGSIYWSANPTGLYLPANCMLTLINLTNSSCASFNPSGNGLQPADGNCTASQILQIGGVQYSSCNGGGNNIGGNFSTVNFAGGAYFATLPLSNKTAICSSLNEPISLSGSVVKYITGSLGTLYYNWSLLNAPPSSGYTFSGSNLQSVSNVVLSSPGIYEFQLTITSSAYPSISRTSSVKIEVGGSTSFNGANWSNGLPTNTNHRHSIITSNYSTSANSIDACSCTVNTGAVLTISPNTYMSVVGNITNYGTAANVVVESDGNLLQVNNSAVNSGDILVKRNMVFRSNERKEYNYLTSPVENFNLKTGLYRQADGTAVTAPFVLYHNEANNFFYTSSGAYIKGRALAVKEPLFSSSAVATAFFTGKPFNGTIDYNLAYSGTTLGYNLVGNPYPSNLDLNLLYVDNSTEIESTFRFWDNTVNTIYQQQGSTYTGNAYAIYNAAAGTSGTGLPAPGMGQASTGGSKVPNKIAKIGQGFMVKARGTGKILKYSNTVRLADNTAAVFFGKQSPDDRYWLTMKAPSGITSMIAVVYFSAGNMAFGMDDSLASSSSDNLYSYAQVEKVAINGRSSFVNTDKINLGSSHFVQGNYTIALGDREGIFASGQNIYLKDKQTGIITNLSAGDYSFTAVVGESTGRFEIIYLPETVLATDTAVKDELQVYRDGGDFVVKAQAKKITSLEVFDASGRMVYQSNPNSAKVNVPSATLANGMYILKIDQSGKISNRKILR